jgi:two-component system, OmpR family, sensor histidine kinase TctE
VTTVEPRSLRVRLLLMLVVPLAALLVAGVLFDFFSTRRMIGESHDRALASAAIGLAARVEADRDGDLPAHLIATMRAVSRLSEADDWVYLVLDDQGQRIAGDVLLAPLAHRHATENPRIEDAVFAGRPVRTATYAYTGPEGNATIVVAEGLDKRLADARRILLSTTTTNVGVALVMLVAAVLSVGFALRPLAALGARVEGHEVQALRPMSMQDVPAETQPLVRAINRLMDRLRATTQARQSFIDNTAHQLRTPLAGLQAQVALLVAEGLPAPANARVQELQSAVLRLSHLTHQMLSLARASHLNTDAPPLQDVALPDLLQQAASACLDSAIAKGVDLGFESAPAVVPGSPWMLREMLVNLVDNAIQHTPHGSVVTVRCGRTPQGPFLEVEDNGPGIDSADRVRVFDRHVRLASETGHGTGLGLAIVREIAERHHARVALGDVHAGYGLRARVEFFA